VSELQGIAPFKFHEGKLEEFKRLSASQRVGALAVRAGSTSSSRAPLLELSERGGPTGRAWHLTRGSWVAARPGPRRRL
jgi:hypothetical protein